MIAYISKNREISDLPDEHVVSSVRVVEQGKHAHMQVYNRGALSGKLVVNVQDQYIFLRRLLGEYVELPQV